MDYDKVHAGPRKNIMPVAHDMPFVWNNPVACNRASADSIISSSLLSEEYCRLVRA